MSSCPVFTFGKEKLPVSINVNITNTTKQNQDDDDDDDDVKVVSFKTCSSEMNTNWENTTHCFHPNQPLRWQAAMKYPCTSTDLIWKYFPFKTNKMLTKLEILYAYFSYHHWQCYKLKMPKSSIKFSLTSFPEKIFLYLCTSESTFVTTHTFLLLGWEF